MQPERNRPVSGHVFVVDRARGRQWYIKWRDGLGQHQERLGPVWEHKGAPPEGWFRRPTASGKAPTDVLAARDAKLTDARRGDIERLRTGRTGVTFEDAAREWLAHGKGQRALKASTLKDYTSAVERHLIPEFKRARLDTVDTRRVSRWLTEWIAKHDKPRQAAKLVAILHGIFELARKRHGLKVNPAADVERPRVRYDSTAYDFYSREEVRALRAAASDQDGAMYTTAAFAGLRRGELVALRWRDVDFTGRTIRVQGNYSHGEVVTPKSGHGRRVPLASAVAEVLAKLGQREHFTGPEDLVFPNETGGHLDASALRRRYITALKAADLRPLRFHDLRHTFGSLAIDRASITAVQAWMGHADAKTTMRYLHHKHRPDEADQLDSAIHGDPAPAALTAA